MKNKKIVVNSLVLALGLGVLSPAANAVIAGGGSHLSPFVSEAYAAQGQIIELGEGRSMEVLEEPEVKFFRVRREHSPMKFRLKGFKEGDKLYLADLTEYTYLDDGFSKKKGDKNIGGYSLFPVPEYSIIDSNHGINIAKHPYSHYGPIIFNKNVEKYETVDISLDGRNYWYFDPLSFEDSPYNKSEPIESFYMARLVTNETKNSDWIEFKKNVFDVSEFNLPKGNRHGFMNGIYPTLTEEDSTEKDTDYFMNIGVTSYLGGSIKKGQYFSYEIFVPKGMKFKNDKKIDKDFISKSINNTVRQGFSRDYDKGITSRGLLSSDRKTFKDFNEVGLDYKYSVREEDGYDVHKYTFTNINGYIDNYTLIKGIGDFPFIVELEDLDLSNPTKVVINNPKKIIKFKTTKKFTNKNGKEDIAEKTSLLDSVSIPQGSVDAFGVLRLDFTKPISKLQVTPLNKQPEDITEFLTNYTGVSGIESVEYKDGKKPDVSKAIEKMPVDLVITYDDGRKEDFKSLLTVTPIEEPAKFNTKYQADSKLKFKEEKVVQEGKDGLQRNSGPENIEVLEPAVDKIISVGNVEKIEESIPHEEERILDKTLTPGTEKVVQEGKDGVKTITKTYTVDPAKGLIADNPKADEKVTPAEDRIIHYNDIHPEEEGQVTESETPLKPAVVTKNFSVHSKNTMPVETFEFELNPSKEGPEKEGMQEAPDSLVKLKEDSLKFGDDEDDQKTIGLSIDAKEAGKPGIYRVKVQEKAGKRKGLTYDDAVRYIDFYVARNKNGELEVKHTVVYKEVKKGDNTEYVKQDGGKVMVNGDEVTSAVTFENMYFQEKDDTGKPKDKTPENKPDPTDPENPKPYDPENKDPKNVPEEKKPDDENQEYNITVGKRISDDSIDRDETKEFEINVTIEGQEGDKFTLYKIDKNGNETTDPIKLASGSKATTLKLKHGEKYKIYGLTYDDTIKVEEVNADKFEKLGELKTPVAVGNLNENILVVNKSKTSTPTGLIQNMAPYAVVLSVALVGGTLYIKAKKEEELA